MKGLWWKQEQKLCIRKERRCTSFHCLVEEWKACEELKPKPKKVDLCGSEEGRDEASDEIVCGSR